MTHVHFIGIGGSGLSAIAVVLLQRGAEVSGSDMHSSVFYQPLHELGASLFLGHAAENIAGADLVVRSSAVPDDNPEVQAARQAGIPVLKRQEFLEQLFDAQAPVAVAGTHGKTTTTAMIAWLLTALNADPSFVIGSVAANMGVNARAGNGRYFVIEADEYDGMFLGIRPAVAVVTNIEHDHPDCYPTAQEFYSAFRRFAGGLRRGGVLIACGDNPGARALLAEMQPAGFMTRSYGLAGENLDYSARNLSQNSAGGLTFDVLRRGSAWLEGVSLRVPGEHNVANALAALSVVDFTGFSGEAAARALGEFQGAERRFQVYGVVEGITLVDDYAHHPTEIRATLSAARQRYPGRRIWAVWQPHTFSRARLLRDEFAAALDAADCVLVTEIYRAREALPADGFSGEDLYTTVVRRRGADCVSFAADLDRAVEVLLGGLKSEDVLLVLSAGDANRIIDRMAQELPRRSAASTAVNWRGKDA